MYEEITAQAKQAVLDILDKIVAMSRRVVKQMYADITFRCFKQHIGAVCVFLAVAACKGNSKYSNQNYIYLLYIHLQFSFDNLRE